ncbi:YciI family protein [Egicoccus sp. AB-alg2]|uniref:YciI family protein n=1 Tax=Egicoccus sp. AB-alg2 TaxID=3242693 RepID=UPI00359DA398
MKQYLLSVHYVAGEPEPDADTMKQMYADVEELNGEMRSAGAWVFAGGLEEPHLATVVREQDGRVVTTDGPFPEAKEHLGGFWVLKVADEEEALDWARKATRACRGPVEVRPFQDEPEV